jgi:murein L,D-transpeptidase YafK
MKVKIPLQKSIFFKAIAGLIFLNCFSAFLLACNINGNENPEDEGSIQARKRPIFAKHAQALKSKVDSILVFKSQREMHVYGKGKKTKTYIISLGSQAVGKKRQEGDYKTPEGRYTINDKNANSIYHKNLGVSYPNENDRNYARRNHLEAGGDIKIHGLPNKPKFSPEAYLRNDWTWGCIAVSNEEIDELYRYVSTGTPIVIFP